MENRKWKAVANDYGPPEKEQKPSQRLATTTNRLPIGERISFSVGHVLNDLVVAAWVSYVLIIQTKVIGLSPKTSGYIWVVVSISDCFSGLIVGSICDNVYIPWFSRRYGQRKVWHLMGTLTVASTFPFLMMPCLHCAEDTSEWKLAIYYSFVFIVFMTAWDMVQTTHTTLIPEIARRPSEIVELNASRFGCTYASGIVMYTITWVLLGEDSQENLSRSQWKDFMYLSLIIVGVGFFCCLIFYVGTKEVSRKERPLRNYKLYKGALRRTPSAVLPLQSLAGDLFPFDDDTKKESFFSDIHQTDRHNSQYDPEAAGQETKMGPQGESGCGERFHGYPPEIYRSKNFPDCSDISEDLPMDIERKHLPVPQFQIQSRDPWVKRSGTFLHAEGCQSVKKQKMNVLGNDKLSLRSKKQGAVVLNNHQCVALLLQLREQCHSSNFSGNQNGSSTKKQLANATPPLQEDFQEEDIIHTSTSTISSGFINDCPSGNDSAERKYDRSHSCSSESGAFMEDAKESAPLLESQAQDLQSSWEASKGTLELRNSKVESGWKVSSSKCQEIRVVIDHEKDEADIEKKQKDEQEEKPCSLKEWFKYPTFYKVSFTFMCSRIVENTMYAYFPIYVVDTLKMDKAAIAYLPLIVLVSGLLASVAAKRLNKVLGSKWTYCMASLTVMTGSAWFCLMPLSIKNMVYVPACLLGGGCCVMLVTSMALIAEMLKGSKMSSATVFNCTTLFAKVATGTSVVLTQQFYPKDSVDEDASGVYVRYAFAVVLGIAALFGLLVVIMFIPAAVKCSRVVRTTDASTQT